MTATSGRGGLLFSEWGTSPHKEVTADPRKSNRKPMHVGNGNYGEGLLRHPLPALEVLPMIESTVSLSRALATLGWSLAVIFILAAWIALGSHETDDHLAILLGVSSILCASIGATFTVSGWVGRVCQVVRLRDAEPRATRLR